MLVALSWYAPSSIEATTRSSSVTTNFRSTVSSPHFRKTFLHQTMAGAGSGQVHSLLENMYQATKTMDFAQSMGYFSNAQRQNSSLRQITEEDFSLFCLQQIALDDEQDQRTSSSVSITSLLNPYPSIAELISMPIAAPKGTAKELWNAVLAWKPDPIRSPPAAAPIPKIHELLRRERFERVPLGTLQFDKGSTCLCALEPTLCLSPDEDAYDPRIPGQRHLTNGHSVQDAVRAIKYADGHPSESSFYGRDKKAGVKAGPVLATEDDCLRRFMPLGYVWMRIHGEWVKTGHALVIDASYGRKCHPWFVLAAEFETNDEEHFLNHGTYTVEVPKKVKFSDSRAIGVLPESSNRTTIAKLEHCDDTQGRHSKFVSHFGHDFKFRFKRMGRDVTRVRSEWGPDRVHIMDWWWDSQKNEEVCFTPAGVPHIRYNPNTREYDGPKDGVLDEIGNIIGIAQARAEGFQPRDLPMPPGPSGSGSSRDRGLDHGRAYGHGQRESTARTAEA